MAEYYGEGITGEAIQARIHSSQEEAIKLQMIRDARAANTPASPTSNHEPLGHQIDEAKRIVDRDRRIRKDSSTSHQNRDCSKVVGSSTPRKRPRKRESCDSSSDTDARYTAPRRYVRTPPKPCSPRRRVEVIIPVSNIDKTLYLPYVPSPRQGDDCDPSERGTTEQSQGHAPASEKTKSLESMKKTGPQILPSSNFSQAGRKAPGRCV